MRVAIIGFGVMGQVTAEKIMQTHEVIVTDPSPTAEAKARDMGVGFADHADLTANMALLFLPGPEVIRAMVPSLLDGHLQVIVDHSTSDPQSAVDMAALAAAAGIGWIDAPVLGRPSSIGNWCLPCGASEGALAKAKPLFDLYARQTPDMGGPGNGHKVKLLNQMMFGAINAMTAEMMATSHAIGIEPARLYEIITASQAGTVSNLFKELGARIAEDDYENPTFSMNLLEKDVRLGVKMARAHGTEPLLAAAVHEMNTRAIEKGHGPEDTAGMWRSLTHD